MPKHPEKPTIFRDGLDPNHDETTPFATIVDLVENKLASLPSPKLEALNLQLTQINLALEDPHHPLRTTHSPSSLKELKRMTNYERRKYLNDSQ
jgi:hypothetical protein